VARSAYPAADDPPNPRHPAPPRNLGFAAEHVAYLDGGESRIVIVSMWLPVAFLATTAALGQRAARRALQADRRARGLCPTCGYDLRATPGRCPECGAVLTAKRAAT
jgi:hypothetical protein